MIETIGSGDDATMAGGATDKDIEISVVVVVAPDAAQRGRTLRNQDAVGDRVERAIAIVPVEKIVSTARQVERGHEQVEIAIVVVIHPRRTECTGAVRDLAPGGNPGEGAIPVAVV